MCTPEPLLTDHCTVTNEAVFSFIGVGAAIAIVNALIFADLLENAMCAVSGDSSSSSGRASAESEKRRRGCWRIVDRLMPIRGVLAGISVALFALPESIAIRAGIPALTVITLIVDSLSSGGIVPYAFATLVSAVFAAVVTLAALRSFGEAYVWSYVAAVSLETLLVMLRKSTRSRARRLAAAADWVCAISIGAAFEARVPLMHQWTFLVSGVILGALPVYEYVAYEMPAVSLKRSLGRCLSCEYDLFVSQGAAAEANPDDSSNGVGRRLVADTAGLGSSAPSTPAYVDRKRPSSAEVEMRNQRTSGMSSTATSGDDPGDPLMRV